MADELAARAAEHLAVLCAPGLDRHPGSPGNKASVDHFERVARSFGWEVESESFDCLEWDAGECWIEVDGIRTELRCGPYSNPCDVNAPVSVVSTVEELEAGEFAGSVLVLRGDIAKDQLFPKEFDFYNPPESKRVYAALERQQPAAVLAITGKNPGITGSAYPFPLIEDGDFDIPNAFTWDRDEDVITASRGKWAHVRIESERIPATGRQLVVRKPGTGPKRAVFFAHIDGRKGIPAALDNASGAASLLVLLELLSDWRGGLAVELVPFNGEDYYGANGQKIWMRDNRDRLSDIVLGLNADDAGHRGAGTGVSFYGVPAEIDALVRALLERYPGFAEGPQWPQSDHSLLTFNGVPAIALTAEDFMETFRTITHTQNDTLEQVDPAIVADVARFAADLFKALDRAGPGAR